MEKIKVNICQSDEINIKINNKPSIIKVAPESTEVNIGEDIVPLKIKNYSILKYYSGAGDFYEGPYVIIPKARTDIILETKDNILTSDITIKEIPYSETSNEYGTTCIIGG